MSTELINRPREGYQLTGFYGGDARGYCLQITSDHGYVQVTREGAALLAADIFRHFLEGAEVETKTQEGEASMNLIDKIAEALDDTAPWVSTREAWQAAALLREMKSLIGRMLDPAQQAQAAAEAEELLRRQDGDL